MLSRKMSWELDSTEIGFFHKAIETDDEGGGVEVIADSILRGDMDLWVWRDDPCVIVVITQVNVQPNGLRELLIRMMSGTSATQNFLKAQDDFSEEARKLGCKRMIAYIKPELFKIFKNLDGVEVQEFYSVVKKEV